MSRFKMVNIINVLSQFLYPFPPFRTADDGTIWPSFSRQEPSNGLLGSAINRVFVHDTGRCAVSFSAGAIHDFNASRLTGHGHDERTLPLLAFSLSLRPPGLPVSVIFFEPLARFVHLHMDSDRPKATPGEKRSLKYGCRDKKRIMFFFTGSTERAFRSKRPIN